MTNDRKKLTPQALRAQLAILVDEMPYWRNGRLTPAVSRWVGKASALVTHAGDLSDQVKFKAASGSLGELMFTMNGQTMESVVHHVLAMLEIEAADTPEGIFIPAGSPFGAMVSVGRILEAAKKTVRVVDAYGDEAVMRKVVPMVGEGIAVQVLTTNRSRPQIEPLAKAWRDQYDKDRPLEVRLVDNNRLHDRYIIVDGREAWKLGQSFNQLAEKSATTITREPTEIERQVLDEWDGHWAKGTPV